MDVTKDLRPNMAYSDRRVVVAPGKSATVQIRGSFRDGACVFWSKSPRIESESWVIGQGEDLETWSAETWIDPRIVDVPSAERTHALVDILNKNRKAGVIPDELRSVIEEYSDVFAVSDKELTQTNLVTHDIDVEIVTEVTVVGAGKASVHLHVQQSKDDTLLLGTNALSELGISLRLTPYKDRDVTKDLHPIMAYSDRRVVVAPGKIATVRIRGSFRDGACVFWSKSPRIESESWVIGQGEDLGTWSAETWIDPRIVDVPSDMMVLQQHAVLQDTERTHALVDILNKNRKAGVIPEELRRVIEEYSDVFALSDKELTQTNLVTHDIDVGGHPPIRQKTRPVPYGIRADSIGFAISFYRAHCIHMTLATVADARGVTQGYLPRSKSDPYNLPNMYVDAVKFANENPWTEMSWRLVKPRRMLIVLPEGFQDVLDCFESPLMTAKLAIEPDDIQAAWFEEVEWSAIMLFSPARYVVASRWMNAWF
ncbi:unnamed protein product, partial [Haemonchus placei]|uniref:NPCBM domain-containing protein n=1 Tax=Haemonchus placei TaxID=6290 RepID=A0A0N4X452_HAEPC